MKKMLLLISFILLIQFSAFSQEEFQCPKIQIVGPDSTTGLGETMIFSVSENIKKDFEKAEFKWSVDKGKIIKGQGTSKIEVDTNGLDYAVVNATLEILNLPENCKNSFSESGVVAIIGDPIASDQYEKLTLKDELLRLDNFLIELKNVPEDQGYIIMSFEKRDSLKLAKDRVRKLSNHIKRRGFPAERITFLLDKSQSKDETVLWKVPKDVKYLPFTTNETIKITNDK